MKKSKFTTRRLVMTAMLACMAFVLNTFVHFPAMAPFQHFVNAMAAVTVGPWLGSLAGFLTGVFRIACGSDIGSITGAIFGPILGGLLYRRFHSVAAVWIGEVIGTGVIINASTAIFDATTGEYIRANENGQMVVPEGAVVVAGSRPISKGPGAEQGVHLYCPVIVKYRDAKTSGSITLEDLLR